MSSELEQPCPMCGEPVVRDAGECPSCGEKLTPGTEEPDPPIDTAYIRLFHNECRALSLFYLFCGVFSFFVLFVVRQIPPVTGAGEIGWAVGSVALFLSGGGWIWSGVATWQRQMLGVQVGLLICLVMAVLNLIILNICALIPLLLIPLQAYRVMEKSRKLKAAGISVTDRS